MNKFNAGDKVLELNKEGLFSFNSVIIGLFISTKPDLSKIELYKTIKSANKNFCCFDHYADIPVGRKKMPKGMDYFIYNQNGKSIRLDGKSSILHKDKDASEIKLILKKSLDIEITKALAETALKMQELEQQLHYLKTHGSHGSQMLLQIEKSLENTLK